MESTPTIDRTAPGKAEFLYATALLITIPILTLIIICIIVVPVRNTMLQQQKDKTTATAKAIGLTLSQNVGFTTRLQNQLDELKAQDIGITKIAVAQKTEDGSNRIVATTEPAQVGQQTGDVDYAQPQANNRVVVRQQTEADGQRTITAYVPLREGDSTLATASVQMSLKSAEDAINKTILRSVIFGVGIVFLMCVLLFNHLIFVNHLLQKNKPAPVEPTSAD